MSAEQQTGAQGQAAQASAPPESFVRSTVRPLSQYAPPRDPAAVGLHLNESAHDLPAGLKHELAAQIEAMSWAKYPITDGLALAADLAKAAGVDAAGTLVGNGSNELLQLLLMAVIEPGDAVVVAEPSFSLYGLQARALGAKVVEVSLRAPDGSFRFPIDELIAAARSSNAKLTLLGSPNNPTGTVLTAADAQKLLQGAPGLIGIDEAYREFCGQDFAPLLKSNPRLVLFRTFSKALAGASLRCGCLFAAPSLCAELRKIQLPYNLSAQTCLVARALIARPELVRQRAEEVQAERARVQAFLESRGCRVHPSGANFLLFEQARKPAAALHKGLFDRGVLIRNVSTGKGLGSALRVSIGAREQNDAFLAALAAELPA